MLLINYEDYRRRYPHLKGALDTLESFLADRPDLKHIDPLRVLYKYPNLSTWELGVALSLLAKDGVLEQVFAVMAPNRALARGRPYKSLSDIPQTLYDAQNVPFDRAEGELVPIFTGRSTQ